MTENFRPNLTREEVNECPLFRYEGKIVIVRDQAELELAVERIKQEDVVGFDTETRPTFVKGKTHLPALVQIACSDVVFLVQLRWISLREPLLDVLEDPHIIKSGVALHDDMRLLQGLHPFNCQGVFDLSEPARKQALRLLGLRGMAAAFLGVRISKNAQCSNWNVRDLSDQQITYAATDAWISRELFMRMRALNIVPPPAEIIAASLNA